jgi:hypothetical protein
LCIAVVWTDLDKRELAAPIGFYCTQRFWFKMALSLNQLIEDLIFEIKVYGAKTSKLNFV